jgi:creatinine amidohydrolase
MKTERSSGKSSIGTREPRVLLFDEMTSPEVAEAIRTGAPIMVGAGATEQHGAHLPLNSDTLQASDIAIRVARRLAAANIPFVVGPTIQFGPRPFRTESPRDFPGTINLSHATLKAVFEDVGAELIAQGFRTIYLLLANAETDPILQLVAKELSERTPAQVTTLNFLVAIRTGYRALMKATKPQSHGGEGETCRMLATAPHLVHMDRARSYHPRLPGQPAIEGDSMPYLGGAIGRYRPPDGMFDDSFEGIWGDPGLASAEVGEKVYGLITDWIVQVVKQDLARSGAARGNAAAGRAGTRPSRARRS